MFTGLAILAVVVIITLLVACCSKVVNDTDVDLAAGTLIGWVTGIIFMVACLHLEKLW